MQKLSYRNIENINTITEILCSNPATWTVGPTDFVRRVVFVEEVIGAGLLPYYVGLDKNDDPVLRIRVDACTITYRSNP